jgi:hypothetical protein
MLMFLALIALLIKYIYYIIPVIVIGISICLYVKNSIDRKPTMLKYVRRDIYKKHPTPNTVLDPAHLWQQATETYRHQLRWFYQGKLYQSLDEMLDVIYSSPKFQEEERQWRARNNRFLDEEKLEQGVVPPLYRTYDLLRASFVFSCNQISETRAWAIRERAKVTPRLRFTILQRDGFKCQICNASKQDGVVLEVDHIIPISKGGKTEESNLLTLCMPCNRGKYTDIF